MDEFEPFLSIGVALGVGLLIGLQREQAAAPEEQHRFGFLGGARTHPLFALAGALSVLLAESVGPWVIGVVLGALLVLVGLAYVASTRRGEVRALTSEAALLVTFLLGALAMSPDVLDTPW